MRWTFSLLSRSLSSPPLTMRADDECGISPAEDDDDKMPSNLIPMAEARIPPLSPLVWPLA